MPAGRGRGRNLTAVRLAELALARNRTIIVLGHNQSGIPPEAMDLVDIVVEIPMVGTSATLNVASPAR